MAAGTSQTISVLSTDTVHQVKKKCSQITGISVDDISINFATKKLNNSLSLHEYGIASGEMSLVFLGLEEDSDQEGKFDEKDVVMLVSLLHMQSCNRMEVLVLVAIVLMLQMQCYDIVLQQPL